MTFNPSYYMVGSEMKGNTKAYGILPTTREKRQFRVVCVSSYYLLPHLRRPPLRVRDCLDRSNVSLATETSITDKYDSNRY